jgi:hypothetical protein
MKEKLSKLFINAGQVWKSYPYTLSFALLASISIILAFEIIEFSDHSILFDKYKNLRGFPFTKIGLISMMGISLFFTLSMLKGRDYSQWLPVGGVILLAGYYLLFPNDVDSWSTYHITIFFVLVILHHLAVSFLPAVVWKSEELDFWSYNKSLFTNIGQTVLFVGVLTAGLLLAILAIENLFNLNIPTGRPYLYIALFSAIFGSAFVFLLFGLDGYAHLVSDRVVPTVQKFFVQYILIPLLLIYAGILYAYGLKILFEWSLPKGWVSYMIFAYSALGLVSLLLIFPLSKQTDKAWVRWFDKVFYLSLLPLLILLFVAILTRLLDYGITPNRYFILITAIWVSCLSLYFILKKNANIKVIPISLFVCAFISIGVPYFNAFSVSVRSQKSQFIDLVQQNDLLENNRINFEKQIESETADRFSSIASFLTEYKQFEFLDIYFGETSIDSIYKKYTSDWEFLRNFKQINYSSHPAEYHSFNARSSNLDQSKFVDVSKADFILFSEAFLRNQDILLEKNTLSISLNNWDHYKRKALIFTLKDEQNKFIDEYDVIPFINDQYEKIIKYIGDQGYTDVEDFNHSFSLGNYEFTIQFMEVQFSSTESLEDHYKSEDLSLDNIYFNTTYVLLVKRKEK